MKRLFFTVLSLVFLWGCAAPPQPSSTQPASLSAAAPEVPEATVPMVTHPVHEEAQRMIQREAAILTEENQPPLSVVLQCEAPGTQEKRGEQAVIDYSNSADGYVMAQFFALCETRLKLRVTGPTTTYTYNLPQGEWTVFPLSDGNGNYQVTIYLNTSGNKYATVMSASFQVSLVDEFAPFLRPNQYVNYTDAPETIALGAELCSGLSHPLEKVAAVYDYVVGEFSYDYDKAATVKSGYLPVLDSVLAEKKGICFDYAAVMAAMLRSQEVPCKLVVGYAGTVYHAWISVWTEENGWVDGAIFFDGYTWKRMDPTFASSQSRSDEIMDYIEHGTYTTKYLY